MNEKWTASFLLDIAILHPWKIPEKIAKIPENPFLTHNRRKLLYTLSSICTKRPVTSFANFLSFTPLVTLRHILSHNAHNPHVPPPIHPNRPFSYQQPTRFTTKSHPPPFYLPTYPKAPTVHHTLPPFAHLLALSVATLSFYAIIPTSLPTP